MIHDRLREWWARRLERCGVRLERWSKALMLRAASCQSQARQLSLDIEDRQGKKLWRGR